MDKFDERLHSAKEDYTPSAGFVDRTMGEVKKHKIHRRRFSFKIAAPAFAGAFALLAIAIILVPKPAQDHIADTGKVPINTKVAQSAITASPASISDGSDNASLDRDLNSVQSSLGQSGNDQSNVDNAVNDSKQEISIPN